MRRAAWMLLATVTAIGVLLLFVFPGRTLLDQNRAIAAAEQHITALDKENAILRRRQLILENPVQIEQIARQRFGLVLPGQQAFAISSPPVSHPAKAPPVPTRSHHWWQALEFWR
jgi:cell division protein FtsB